MGLYLLIWGEAANVRFMPECLCYIFHNVMFVHTYLFINLFLDFLWKSFREYWLEMMPTLHSDGL